MTFRACKLIGLTLTALLSAATLAHADTATPTPAPLPNSNIYVPDSLKDIAIEEHLDGQLPLDLNFVNEMGQTVALKDYFKAGRPVVLQLGYLECPMLCGEVARGLVNAVSEQTLKLGADFEVVSISIDPSETWQMAQLKKKQFAKTLGKPDQVGGMNFLVGEQAAIDRIATAVGFKYKWVEQNQQYSHPAVLMIATPDGKLSRYLYGVRFPAQTLRLSLVEAGQGKIGTAMDQILLTCFHYDDFQGKYSVSAMNFMRLGGAMTALIVAGVLVNRWVRDARSTENVARITTVRPDRMSR